MPTLTLLLDPHAVWLRVPASMNDARPPSTLTDVLDWFERLVLSVQELIPPNPLFEAVLLLTFASKRVVGQYPMRLEAVAANVVARLQRGQVHPGEMVGVVAAQSISEPATQQAFCSLQASVSIRTPNGD